MSRLVVSTHCAGGGVHIRTSYRWCRGLRNAALSYEMYRRLEGPVEADELYHTAGNKGQVKRGGVARSASPVRAIMIKTGLR